MHRELERNPRSRAFWPRFLLGVGISCVALGIVLWKIDLAEIRVAMAGVLPLPVGGMLLLRGALLGIRKQRWSYVLGTAAPGATPRGLFRAVCLGYLGNFLLPLKAGELIRAEAVRRANPGLQMGQILGTVGVERALDAAVLGLLVALLLPFVQAPAWIARGTAVLLACLFGALAVALPERIHLALERRVPEHWLIGRALRWMIRSMSAGSAVLRRPRELLPTLLWTTALWLAEGMVLRLGMLALGMPLGYEAALIVTFLYNVGLMLPSAPAQIGTHQAFAVAFLGPFGIAAGVAVTYSLLLQAVNLAVFGSLGLAYLAADLIRGRPQ